eukprot:gene17476-20851_t
MIGQFTNNYNNHTFDSFPYENSFEEIEDDETRFEDISQLPESKRKRLAKFFTLSKTIIRNKLNVSGGFRLNISGGFRRETLISRLPVELIVHIVGFLSHSDIWNIMLVCREWMSIGQDEYLWRLIYQNYFVYRTNRELFEKQRKAQTLTDVHWREIFKTEYVKEMRWSSDVYKEAYLHGHTGTVWTLLYDDTKGLVYTGSFDKTAKVWDFKTRRCLFTMTGHSYPVQCLDVKQGHMATGSLDNSIRLWDLENKTCKSVISNRAHNFDVFCLQMVDNLIISGSSDSTVKLWNVHDIIESNDCIQDRLDRGEAHKNEVPVHQFKHASCVTCLQVQDNILMSGGSDKVVRVWDLNTQMPMAILEGHEEGIRCLQFEGNLLVTGSNDNTVKLWDLRSKYSNYSSLKAQGSIRSLQWQGTSLITASNDQMVRWWNLNTGSSVDLLLSDSSISCLRFKDNLLMCGLSDSKVQMLKFMQHS